MGSDDLYLGFDPGGQDGFGVALIDANGTRTATVSSVAEAMEWTVAACGSTVPAGGGIDSLLHWCDGPGGWRPADRELRDAYPAAKSSVLSPNGLYGAMSVGGMALAMRLREKWPAIPLTETHPKLLAYALRQERHRDAAPSEAIVWFARHTGLGLSAIDGGHELDAVISAWAAREGFSRNWTDIITHSPSLLMPAGRVNYLWIDFPEKRSLQTVSKEDTLSLGKSRSAATTSIGYLNKHNQQVIKRTDLPGTDHGQRIYILRCLVCHHEYGANGSDIFQRKCPSHGGGAPGLPFKMPFCDI
jgi:hypothetical protein